MKASDRITAAALIGALTQQQISLSPEFTQQLQTIGKTEPLDWNKLHGFAMQSPLKSSYLSLRIFLQREAGERGKGAKPIIPDDDGADTPQLENYVASLQQQEPSLLEEQVREFARSDDAVARCKSKLASLPFINSFGG